jgi:Domain of unknown function (DUF6915)
LAIHDWFGESKAHIAAVRQQALRHHSEGIFLCEAIFGTTLTNSVGKTVPVRTVGEPHVKDDLGWIPSRALASRYSMMCRIGAAVSKLDGDQNYAA